MNKYLTYIFTFFFCCGCLLAAPAEVATELQLNTESPELNHLRVSGEFLYFKAIGDSIFYSLETPSEITTPQTEAYTGKFVEPHWQYDPGFRFSLFFPITYDDWEIGSYWTSLNSSASISKSSSTYDLLAALAQASPGVLSGNAFVDYVSGKYKLHFNVFDISLERTFVFSKGCKFRPILSIEGAVIQQHSTVHYDYFIVSGIATSPQLITVKNKNWGVGPKVALNVTFAMPKGVGFNFLAGFSSLFGNAYVKTTEENMLNNGPSLSFVVDGNRLFSSMQLQASFEKTWQWDYAGLTLLLGWETQTWFRQLRFNYVGTICSPSEGGDLTLQGPFARFSMDF